MAKNDPSSCACASVGIEGLRGPENGMAVVIAICSLLVPALLVSLLLSVC